MVDKHFLKLLHNNGFRAKMNLSKMVPDRRSIWVLGYGYFGKRALSLILENAPDMDVTVVDRAKPNLRAGRVTWVQADGVVWLTANLSRSHMPEMIVPAVQVHVVVSWLCHVLHRDYTVLPWVLPSSLIMPYHIPCVMSLKRCMSAMRIFFVRITARNQKNIVVTPVNLEGRICLIFWPVSVRSMAFVE